MRLMAASYPRRPGSKPQHCGDDALPTGDGHADTPDPVIDSTAGLSVLRGITSGVQPIPRWNVQKVAVPTEETS
jgi:hypothetical protein